jgi:hypothetical protein
MEFDARFEVYPDIAIESLGARLYNDRRFN